MIELGNNLGFILGTSLFYAAPLIFAALGGTISENAGVVNIGLEGTMVVGAFAGATVGYFTGNPWLGFLAGGFFGMLLCALHGVATINFGADHVVSGIAINFLGPGLALFASRAFFEGATQTLPIANKLPKLLNFLFPGWFDPSTGIPVKEQIPGFLQGLFFDDKGNDVFQYSFWNLVFNQDMSVVLALLLVVVLWLALYKTRWGLRLRSVGEHPHAADSLGINVYLVKYEAVLLSGFFAGMGGAAMSISVMSNFFPALISGQGFIALAAMIFGKWKPHGAMVACLFFGLAKGLEIFLGRPEYLGKAEWMYSTQLLALLPYVLTIIVLVSFVGKAVAPKADGQPFVK